MAVGLFLLLVMPPDSALAQGITVSMVPQDSNIEPGEVFFVNLEVTQAGIPFNGYYAHVMYDTNYLTILPLLPSSFQEGPLMTGACGNTFHAFSSDNPGFCEIWHSLLCSGQSITGPGILYSLRFQAADTTGSTFLEFLEDPTFYDAGLFVGPVFSTDVLIEIGGTTDAEKLPIASAARLQVFPNPSRGSMRFRWNPAANGPVLSSLAVMDIKGRIIRRWSELGVEGGEGEILWDGTDDLGERVRAGIYWAVARSSGTRLSTRFVILN